MSESMTLECSVLSRYSLAFQQNQYPLISNLKVANVSDSEALKDIQITLISDPVFFEPLSWSADILEPGQTMQLPSKTPRVAFDKLNELTEEVIVHLRLIVASQEETLVERKFETIFMPKNFWAGELGMPELLAAFCTPSAPYVENLVISVSKNLAKYGHPESIDGYQSATREKPYLMASALWAALKAKGIVYINPTPTFATKGQRIRLPDDFAAAASGACLDISMLFAACLERMGLNSLVLLTNTHAFVGVWLIDDCLPVVSTDDPMDIRKRIASQDLVIFETTLVTGESQATFAQACEQALSLLSEENESEFVLGVDVKQSRKCKIKPIPTFKSTDEQPEETEGPVIVDVPPPPPLPPVRREEIIPTEETAETRVDQWKRKLLDLTKRNRLLNLAANAVAVKLFCPNIGRLEDKLAADEVFSFLPAENTPIADKQRDNDIFRFETGNALQNEFAIAQLENNSLIVNDTKKRVDSRLLSLFRKAKSDLEEGGSNTLYLSIGMLRWKEAERLDKSYRAPLILLPVELLRASARSPIRIKQIKDEDPVFNSTLIQFLQEDFEIDLSQFRNELPKDDSGVDVNEIWTVIREKIKDTPGFEVVEELVLSTFSFAKYLMWKDLQDRVEQLKENNFVEHLVERPTEIFQQDVNFIDPKDVDKRINPADIFAPMNADSSQLVAIEASGHAQDFVMEGPPGTGKSETIANIICHNLALGKKVLFVAEKMAALNVVYKRLLKVGLNHLCLELHSNKANKTAVLEQLRNSWQGREAATQSDWLQRAESLKGMRDDLNKYVSELHKNTKFGFSPREAIARAVRYRELHKLPLEWGKLLEDAPIKDAEGLDRLKSRGRNLSIAFSDLDSVDTTCLTVIHNENWSNSWQSELIKSCRKILMILDKCGTDTEKLLKVLGLPVTENISLRAALAFNGFSEAVESIVKRNFSIAFSGRVRAKLLDLEKIISEKLRVEKELSDLGVNIPLKILVEMPTEVWAARYIECRSKIWPASFFGLLGLRKEIKLKTGFRLKDLSKLDRVNDINVACQEIIKITPDFEPDKIWRGWETSIEDMRSDYDELEKISSAIREILSCLKIDPAVGTSCLKNILSTNWDFLESNLDLLDLLKRAQQNAKDFLECKREFEETVGSELDDMQALSDFKEMVSQIVQQERKINSWCNWLDAKKQVSSYKIEPLIEALENKIIKHQDFEENLTTSIMAWFAPRLIDRSNILRNFSASTHNALIQDFIKLDANVADTTAKFIIAKTASLVPSPGEKTQPAEYGVLSRELTKKSRIMPVRKLVEEMGPALLNLTPCMMMSPLSVAQFLPANYNNFDLVVFDEASQITVWDSVGAIARGKNTIVVGDPKQMPPTNFFGRGASEDADEEDLESILDQAIAARVKHHRLTGHYRSRHESLIAFSNSHYYENSLVTFPSAETKASAVTKHFVPGVYAKGKARNNPIEAKAVAKEVLRRLKDPELNHLSIGIVAMNSEQQRTIEDELDNIRRANPMLEGFFQGSDSYDPVFVKNLESVQGDERDVIMLSVGYGPTEPGAKSMSMNFGPLNKQGGERRLNVAVTRATTELILFASFDSGMIDLSRTQAMAVKHLKSFFEFAEQGPSALAAIATTESGVDQFDSDFEQAVAFKLRELGWTVQTQIGVGKFRIDMGVVHPDKPGKFLAGVECDGATYHGSPAARDRDRVRQTILENLGWTIIRLWSTDYFIDPDGAVEKINFLLKEALEFDQRKQDKKPPENKSPVKEKVALADLDKSKFYKTEYQDVLIEVLQTVLEEMNGISLSTLVNEVSRRFGIARSTERQTKHILKLIQPWAGISRKIKSNPTIWRDRGSVVGIIDWRGLAPFGIKRHWKDISFHEQLGAVEYAIKSGNTPLTNVLKDMFQLDRLTASTSKEFDDWCENYGIYMQEVHNQQG